MKCSLRADACTDVGFRIAWDSGEPIEEANRFLQTLWARGLSRLTIRTYGYGLVVLFRWMEATERSISSLTEEVLMEWVISMRERDTSPHTINHRLVTTRLLYSYIVGKELPSTTIGHSNAKRIPSHFTDPRIGTVRLGWAPRSKSLRVRAAHRLVEPLTPGQVNGFLASIITYRDLSIVLLMLLCGLRSGEVLFLRLADLHLAEARIQVRGKGNRERILPLPESLCVAIRKYLHLERPPESSSPHIFLVLRGTRRGAPMTASGLRSLFRVRRRAGTHLRIANPHRFRHTFGADMARAGVRLPVLQRMMGHASGLMTLRYIRLSVEDIAEEYRRAMDRIEKRYDPPPDP